MFLKTNKFDFNKAFLHGVHSLRRADEKALLEQVENAFSKSSSQEKMEFKGNMKLITNQFDKVAILQ